MPFVRTVEEMILSLPRNEAAIVTRLRSVPYYSRHRQICYIFPSSALYGAEEKKHVTVNIPGAVDDPNRRPLIESSQEAGQMHAILQARSYISSYKTEKGNFRIVTQPRLGVA